MPAPLSNVKFGTVGGIREAARRWGYSPIEVIAGKDRLEYYQEGQNTYTLALDIYESSGIKRFTGGVSVDSFTAISLTEEETIVGPHKIAAEPREVPEFGKMLVINDYLMITHKTVRTSLTLRGELPDEWKSNKRGSVVGPYTWDCAYGDYSFETPESFIGEVGTTERITDLDESTVEMSATVPSADNNAQTHLIDISSELNAYLEDMYQLALTTSMSPDASPEMSYTVTNFLMARET